MVVLVRVFLGVGDGEVDGNVSLCSAWNWGLRIYMLGCGREGSSLGFVFDIKFVIATIAYRILIYCLRNRYSSSHTSHLSSLVSLLLEITKFFAN